MTESNNQNYQDPAQPTNTWHNEFQPSKPDNYLVLAIVATVLGFCSCIPMIFGIIAIVYATQVDSKYTMKDYPGAESASKNAKIFSFISLGITALGIIFSIIYYAIMGAAFWSAYQDSINL